MLSLLYFFFILGGTKPDYAQLILEKIKFDIEDIYDDSKIKNNEIMNFLLGFSMFFGFSIWTISIFRNNEIFNPWSILTLFIAMSGLSMAISRETKIKMKGEFFRIEFHDRNNFSAFLIMGIVGLISMIAMILINQKYSHWMILCGMFILIGISVLMRSVKFVKIEG